MNLVYILMEFGFVLIISVSFSVIICDYANKFYENFDRICFEFFVLNGYMSRVLV